MTTIRQSRADRYDDDDVRSRVMAAGDEPVVKGVRMLLAELGEDPDRTGLLDTPRRFIRAMHDLAGGTRDESDVEALLGRTFDDAGNVDELIAVGPVEFVSVCEHHLLPFAGHAWIGYVPSNGRVAGLSKLPRVLDHYARRPQVQERLTRQVADALDKHLEPLGSAVVLTALHSCMALRGVKKRDGEMVTSALSGCFKTEPSARAEFLALTRGAGR